MSRRLWLLPFLLLSTAVCVQSCAVRFTEEIARPAEPPKPTSNHAVHGENDLECGDCHDPEETGTPSLPKAETCFECHEDLAQENERVNAYFDTARQQDGSYRFQKLVYTADLIPNHEGHAKKEVGCADCHGDASEKAFLRPALLDLKARCFDCHNKREASLECSVCHEEIRREKKPPDHDAAFRGTHGGRAPQGWRTGAPAPSTCVLCHEVPQGCVACHSETKPSSHRAAGFRFHHGRGGSNALDEPFKETSCAVCHQEQGCVRCHQTTKPRRHTASWERRLHGIDAAVERQTCRTCHQQDFCSSCHQTTQPITHTGSWGSGQQTHCVACHAPLPANGCYVCHKNTLGHLAATALPMDAKHATSADPVGCETCHTVLPHLYAGGSCRRCHR